MTETNPAERAVSDLADNPIADLIMQHNFGGISDEPRTLRGEFPGSKDRAMGHAREVVEMCEADGVSATVEYVGKSDEYDLHEIDIVVEGGDA